MASLPGLVAVFHMGAACCKSANGARAVCAAQGSASESEPEKQTRQNSFQLNKEQLPSMEAADSPPSSAASLISGGRSSDVAGHNGATAGGSVAQAKPKTKAKAAAKPARTSTASLMDWEASRQQQLNTHQELRRAAGEDEEAGFATGSLLLESGGVDVAALVAASARMQPRSFRGLPSC